MKILDAYIVKKFLSTFVFIIMGFIVISVVIDLSDSIDDFLESEATVWDILIGYYLNFCIHFGNLLSGLLIFLTVVVVSSNMAQKTEIVAILSGGVSFNRFLRPFFIAATILVLIALLISHIILPWANKNKMEFEKEFTNPSFYIRDKNVHREISPGEIVYFKSISAKQNRGQKFSIENWSIENNERQQLNRKLIAETASFDPEANVWKLKKGQIRTYDSDGTQQFQSFMVLDTTLNLTITDFGHKNGVSSSMTWSELNVFIQELEDKGFSDVSTHLLEKHQRTSIPFSIYVFVLIAVSIASRKLRGGTGIHLMLAVVIGFLYVFFQRVSSVAATNAGVDALIAVWIPNILFLLLGIWLYFRAPK
ncbi:MAG: LptF/LptG family permease [Flavobacteriales bacterium]